MITIDRLQHVSVPRPLGEDAHRLAVEFYGELLGLPELPIPSTFTDVDVTWFGVGDLEIHVFGSGPDEGMAHPGAHFCLVVDDLEGARAALTAAGYPCHGAVPIPNRPRFYARDPFGNEIEFTRIEGDYLADLS